MTFFDEPSSNVLKIKLSFMAWIVAGVSTLAAANPAAANDVAVPPSPGPQATSRVLYNAGTERLLAGKLDDAETLLELALGRQDETVQPLALFNLGEVRFDQGIAELKKSDGMAAVHRGVTAAADGEQAIQGVKAALESDDLRQMVEAYLAGRGARHEMHAATKAVQQAMDQYGRALLKWQRSLNDFKSAAELNPADTNAARNAETVEQAIARLVDSLQKMQSAATALGEKKSELNKLMKELKGKIPAPDMPPGAPGDDGDEDEGANGKQPSPESLTGQTEAETGGGGQEMSLRISPEQAAQLMNSLLPGAKQLPMGQGQPGQPVNRSGRIW